MMNDLAMHGGAVTSSVRSAEDLAALPERATRLMEDSAATFDQTIAWYRAFERHLVAPDISIRYLYCQSSPEGSVTGLLPVQKASVQVTGGRHVPAIRALSNFYTALYGPTLAPNVTVADLDAIAVELVQTASGLSTIDLNPLEDNSAFLAACEWSLRKTGWTTERYPRFGNWYLETNGLSFDQYFGTRSGQLRSTLSRKAKKAGKRGGVQFEIVTNPEQVDSAMDCYEAVYRKSWKADEPHKKFIREIAREFALQGWLRLGIATMDGRSVASQLWFCYRGTASIFKLAYDPEFRDFSVGSLLTAHLMKHALDVDHVTIVDFLCGDDDYKKEWMTNRRQRIGLRATRAASIERLAELAAKPLRRLRRSWSRSAD